MTIVFCLCILISRKHSILFINIFGHANHLTLRCSFASVVTMIVYFNFLLIWVDYLSQTINKNKMSVAACKWIRLKTTFWHSDENTMCKVLHIATQPSVTTGDTEFMPSLCSANPPLKVLSRVYNCHKSWSLILFMFLLVVS